MKKRTYVVLILAFLVLAGTLSTLNRFMDFIESRPGVVIADPILALFEPVDVSNLIFTILYFSVFYTVFHLRNKPRHLTQAFLGFAMLMWVRMLVMYLVPFDPPPKVILLRDPIVEFFGGGERILTRDLFFSGHTAAVYFCALAADHKIPKTILTACALATGLLVLAQHAHYTIDVVGAPFFTYVVFLFTGRVLRVHLEKLD